MALRLWPSGGDGVKMTEKNDFHLLFSYYWQWGLNFLLAVDMSIMDIVVEINVSVVMVLGLSETKQIVSFLFLPFLSTMVTGCFLGK